MGNKHSGDGKHAADDDNPTPGSVHFDPQSKLKVRSPDRPIHKEEHNFEEVEDDEIKQELEQAAQEQDQNKINASEETLVKIPDAMVHLIDKQQSVLLASGHFSLVTLLHNGNQIAVFARVGKDLQWPVLKDELVTKLDSAHYYFTLRVDDSYDGDDEVQDDASENALSYGVTFKVKGNEDKLHKLDGYLEKYSFFSKPKMVQETDGNKEELPDEVPDEQLVPAEVVKDMARKPSEEKSRLYWTTVAPNVEEYNTSIAKGIATGTGHIIRGIFWCSNTTVEQFQKGGQFVKSHSKQYTKAAEISPMAMRNIKRVRRVTRMSERVAKGILTGIVTATGFFTTKAVTSKVGKKFFKMLPGEVALASLDAFSKVFDAVEMAGGNILSNGTMVTTGVVTHKFGEQAGEFTHEGLASVGHVLSTAWVISKIRNVMNPKQTKPSTTGMLKSAAKNAIMKKK